jgi:hypothetical protein
MIAPDGLDSELDGDDKEQDRGGKEILSGRTDKTPTSVTEGRLRRSEEDENPEIGSG